MTPERPDGVGPVAVRHRTVPTEAARLAVVEVGRPELPAWVIAHGVGSSARFVVEAFAGPVARAGRRLVAYDLRGHGASSIAREVGDHHLDVHAQDLARVVERCDGEVEVVGGISLGAHAAVRAVADGARGASVLACLPAWTGRAIPGDGPHAAIAARLATDGVAGHLAAIAADAALPDWLRRTLLADQPRHDPASLAAVLTSLDGGLAPTIEEVASLSVPLAVVGWPDDPGHPLEVAERWAASAARGALVVASMTAMVTGTDHLGSCAVEAVSGPRRAPARPGPRGTPVAGRAARPSMRSPR
ncbi:MAG: alpha/beta fold hydrolase [Nitriliruptoraceae bacterium]